jgi:hypothetical protein
MTNGTIRWGALTALLVCSGACADSVTPTGPTTRIGTMASPPAAPTPPTASDFPAVLRPARIYLFASGLYPVHEWTSGSRYVLYDDGTFALQYLRSAGSAEYRGTYTEANGLLRFQWQANQNVFAPWRPATGTLTDDSLTVRYDVIMIMDDFEDAVYLLTK